MAVVANRRSVMTLFSSDDSPDSHRVRLLLAEKGVTVDIARVTADEQPEDLIELNPYGSVPTLVDRDLVLYDPRVIMEYLDERFPHPPLMPVDPVSRARARLAMYRVEQDWYALVPDLDSGDEKRASKARKLLKDSLTASVDVFAARPFFLSEELSLVDLAILPLLWRLPHWQVKLPSQAKPIAQYAARLFSTETFQASLTEAEREMKP
ncbi:MAG: glutathione S-transferase N-terminal domain-containing protein [Gammaproteobacteria bacterium]